jgi:hypothetical protein
MGVPGGTPVHTAMRNEPAATTRATIPMMSAASSPQLTQRTGVVVVVAVAARRRA